MFASAKYQAYNMFTLSCPQCGIQGAPVPGGKSSQHFLNMQPKSHKIFKTSLKIRPEEGLRRIRGPNAPLEKWKK